MGSGASIEVPADADRETIKKIATQRYGEEKVAEVESKYDEWAQQNDQNNINQFLSTVRHDIDACHKVFSVIRRSHSVLCAYQHVLVVGGGRRGRR